MPAWDGSDINSDRDFSSRPEKRIPRAFGYDPVRDIQVLCPTNRGGVGARSLDVELQKVLNSPDEVRVERFGWT